MVEDTESNNTKNGTTSYYQVPMHKFADKQPDTAKIAQDLSRASTDEEKGEIILAVMEYCVMNKNSKGYQLNIWTPLASGMNKADLFRTGFDGFTV